MRDLGTWHHFMLEKSRKPGGGWPQPVLDPRTRSEGALLLGGSQSHRGQFSLDWEKKQNGSIGKKGFLITRIGDKLVLDAQAEVFRIIM